jgi:hypothetical protein
MSAMIAGVEGRGSERERGDRGADRAITTIACGS